MRLTLRFKHLMKERKESSITGEEVLLSVSEHFGIKPRAMSFPGERMESRSQSLVGYRLVYQNDLVMNYMLAWKGAYGVSEYEGIVSPSYAVFKVDSRRVCPRFLHHRLRAKDMPVLFRRYSKGIIDSRLRLYPEAFLGLRMDWPDLPAQKRIADFLDRQTSRIDELIEKKQRLVELLEERREVLIDAVIHGEVGPAVSSCKQIVPIRRVVHHILNGTTANQGVEERETVAVTRIETISSGKIDFSRVGYIVRNPSLGKYRLKAGDIVLSHINSLDVIGNCAIYEDESAPLFLGMNTLRLRPQQGVVPRFLYWALRSARVRHQIRGFAKPAINQASISISNLSMVAVPLYAWQTQDAIAVYLDRETGKILSLHNKTGESIERLRELRSALITAAVTGQIDVDEWERRGGTERGLERLEEEGEQTEVNQG